jgi:hypothetical protein
MGPAELLVRLQSALQTSQERLGELVGVSRRTVIRWQQRGAVLLPSQWETFARACHPHDRDLAAQCAAHAGETLESLGLERPPLATPPRPAPSAKHLADSVVCAAAEAMHLTPQAMRPGVVAVLERIVALGMNADEVLAAMAAPKAEKPAKAGKASS